MMKRANTTLLLSIALTGMAIAPAFARQDQAAQSALPANAAAPTPAMPGGALTKPQIEQLLASKGYTKVEDLKVDDGLWQAKAKSADGKHVKLKIDPSTGEIVPDEAVSQVSEDDIRASLSSNGYTDVHDVKLDDGAWKAKAKSAEGKKVKLQLSPKDGSIIAVNDK